MIEMNVLNLSKIGAWSKKSQSFLYSSLDKSRYFTPPKTYTPFSIISPLINTLGDSIELNSFSLTLHLCFSHTFVSILAIFAKKRHQ